MVQTIPEMHKYLEELNSFSNQTTTLFIQTINSHPGKFTAADSEEFKDLVEEIRSYAYQKIVDFFNNKHATKCELYESQVPKITCRSHDTQMQLKESTISSFSSDRILKRQPLR
jgi:hypothetical protein